MVQFPSKHQSMLYSGTMNKIVTIALVACVILFIVTIFISPFYRSSTYRTTCAAVVNISPRDVSISVQIIVCLLPPFVGIALNKQRCTMPGTSTSCRCTLLPPLLGPIPASVPNSHTFDANLTGPPASSLLSFRGG